MNRRGFLKALIGAAAAPVVAKIAVPFDGPELSDKTLWTWSNTEGWTVIDLRAKVREQLGRWFAEEMDKLIFAGLAGAAKESWRP